MFGKRNKVQETFGKAHIRKGDTVLVTTGKDRGKRGKVLRVIPSRGTAIVERVNFTKKHTRANPQKNIKGGILEREAPIRMTNLQVICQSCGERTRVGMHVGPEGNDRVCKKCHAELGR